MNNAEGTKPLSAESIEGKAKEKEALSILLRSNDSEPTDPMSAAECINGESEGSQPHSWRGNIGETEGIIPTEVVEETAENSLLITETPRYFRHLIFIIHTLNKLSAIFCFFLCRNILNIFDLLHILYILSNIEWFRKIKILNICLEGQSLRGSLNLFNLIYVSKDDILLCLICRRPSVIHPVRLIKMQQLGNTQTKVYCFKTKRIILI